MHKPTHEGLTSSQALHAGELIIQPSATVMYLSEDLSTRKEVSFAPPRGQKFAALLLGTVPAKPKEHVNVTKMLSILGLYQASAIETCMAELGYPEGDVQQLLFKLRHRAREPM